LTSTANVRYISFVIHHIAFDGWSVGVLLTELKAFYYYHLRQQAGENPTLNLPELSIQYKDFALWQKSYLAGELAEQQLDYWKKQLEGYETLALVSDYPRPIQVDYRGKNLYFTLDAETSNQLRSLAKSLNVSLFSLFLSAYYLCLRSFSHQNDIVVGTPIANRHHAQLTPMLGFFVNTLALRTQINDQESLQEYIQRIGKQVLEAQSYQDIPFDKLVEALDLEKDPSRHPIFQVTFTFENFNDFQKQVEDILFPYAGNEELYTPAKFDLSTFINDGDEAIKGTCNYAVSLFTEDSVINLMDSYCQILKEYAAHAKEIATLKVGAVNLLTPSAYQTIVYNWNNTQQSYPEEKTLHQLFEEQVARTPQQIALVFEDIAFTYQELNEYANQLAHELIARHGLKADDRVALLLSRSEAMIISILGVLKAGAAYVPIEPEYPEERVGFILDDTQAKVVLTDEVVLSQEETSGARSALAALLQEEKVISVNSKIIKASLAKQPKHNPCVPISSNNLAYVIYTSGTTGKPKGVMIEHKSVVNVLQGYHNEITLHKIDQYKQKVLAMTNYVFDPHVLDFYLGLSYGYPIYLIPEYMRLDYQKLADYVSVHQIGIATLTTALLEVIKLKEMDFLSTGGASPKESALDWYYDNGTKLVQVYGPTESCVIATAHRYQQDGANNIGKPLANYSCYVLSDAQQPLPIGAIGELYIGGEGVARGYLNRPELTAERFIANPFQSDEDKKLGRNSRLYKTGDLARWLPQGEIEYIGRQDFQVKIRGQRIELGEVEAALLSIKGISQAVVIPKQSATDEGKNVYEGLLAYYAADYDFAYEEIIQCLEQKLPRYMIPMAYKRLEAIPLTVNGKVDQRALPEITIAATVDYLAPRDEMESKLQQIWADVLDIPAEQISVRDTFFRLGGNSLTSVQLVNQINQKFNNSLPIKVSIKDILIEQTIEKLAILIKNAPIPYEEKHFWENMLSDIKQDYGLVSTASNERTMEIKQPYHKLIKQLKKLQFTHRIDALNAIICLTLKQIFGDNVHHILLHSSRDDAVFFGEESIPVRLESADNLGNTILQVKEALRISLKYRNEYALLNKDEVNTPLINVSILDNATDKKIKRAKLKGILNINLTIKSDESMVVNVVSKLKDNLSEVVEI